MNHYQYVLSLLRKLLINSCASRFMFCFPCLASEELSMGGMRFTTFDLGGHQQGKWYMYYNVIKVVISG